jgi:hypothetical protein
VYSAEYLAASAVKPKEAAISATLPTSRTKEKPALYAPLTLAVPKQKQLSVL